jgi:hypothetical protein
VADGHVARQLRRGPRGNTSCTSPIARCTWCIVRPLDRGDAGGLLPAVLQRVEPEVGEVGGLGVAVHAEHAALVVEVVVVGGRAPVRYTRSRRGAVVCVSVCPRRMPGRARRWLAVARAPRAGRPHGPPRRSPRGHPQRASSTRRCPTLRSRPRSWRRGSALGGGAVAVRSSALHEDAAGGPAPRGCKRPSSGCGVEAALRDAVRRVLGVDLHRARDDLPRAGAARGRRAVGVAVVVQRMVAAERAGVLFTADPLRDDPGASRSSRRRGGSAARWSTAWCRPRCCACVGSTAR